MRIVLVTHYYPPEVNAPAQRAYDHARMWRDAGHEVTIVTAQPSHPYGRLYPGFRNRTQEKMEDGIRVVRLRTVLGPNSGRVRRTINYASFMVAVRLNAERCSGADVVISTSPQFFCGLAGAHLAARSSAPWILEIRDIWPDSIIAVGAARESMATRVVSWLVDWAYKRCDHIVSVSPGFSEHFNSRGVPPDKVTLIPNGILTDVTPQSACLSDFPQLKPIEGRFIGAYLGTLGLAHGTATLLDAAELLRADHHIGILLVGSGAERDDLLEQCRRKRLENVVILDQQPRDRVAQLFSFVSASIVHLKNQPVFRTVIPTKLLEAMAMGKPVLLGVEGVARQILDDSQAGVSFVPEDAKSLAEALRQMAADVPLADHCGRSGGAYVRRHFDRRAMAKRYLETMTAVSSLRRERS